ncbi:MAG TPA: hypothetical protein VGE52_01195 [Pirellulales bacterium]
MAENCAQCGRRLGFFERLDSIYCPQCQAEINGRPMRAAREAKEAAIRAAREAAKTATQAAIDAASGSATRLSSDQQRLLEAEGFLIVASRIQCCPLCGHDRFERRATLLESRAATALGVEWLSRGAQACVCRRCKHVLWFAE